MTPAADGRAVPTPPEDEPAQPWAVPGPHFVGGNQVDLLRGGDQLFPAMRRAIEAARETVWLATYIFHDDPASVAMAQALAAAARRGVRVRVVVDGFGSNRTIDKLEELLAGAGVEVAVFRPLRGWWSWLQPGQLRRLHQKLSVVDTAVGFIGGINIIDDCFDINHGQTEMPRLDFAVQVSGVLVRPMEQAVRAIWTRARLGSAWRDEMAHLLQRPRRIAQLRLLADRLRMSYRDEIPAGADLSAPMQAALVVRDNLRQRRTIERSYVEAIRGASRRVDIVCPYFYPGARFMRALRGAARRGVLVRLVLQGKPDYRIAALAARVIYDDLMRHGVRIFEYTPAFLHAKVAVVDETWATVGSSNIDPLSLLLNLEANLVVRDAGFNAVLAGEIDQAVAASREVRSADIISRGWLGLARRAFVAWAAYVYLRIGGVNGRY